MDGLLPIGSVVLLKDSTKRVMIMGVAQEGVTEAGKKLYDYVGCVFPEGFLSADQNFLFNTDQIDRLYFLGYQDDEALAFKERADELMAKLREEWTPDGE
ncbi:MAG: DUF4176 domain-containing protein [Clostridia bacterium]|nr:DUF4176 domain-containing protein [Clostridia bacterium]MBR4443991.1 DUF4176 domain-containing protein [Clostridia bacterium]